MHDRENEFGVLICAYVAIVTAVHISLSLLQLLTNFIFALDDETSCDYADLPDGNDFDFPEDFLNATGLPF